MPNGPINCLYTKCRVCNKPLLLQTDIPFVQSSTTTTTTTIIDQQIHRPRHNTHSFGSITIRQILPPIIINLSACLKQPYTYYIPLVVGDSSCRFEPISSARKEKAQCNDNDDDAAADDDADFQQCCWLCIIMKVCANICMPGFSI